MLIAMRCVPFNCLMLIVALLGLPSSLAVAQVETPATGESLRIRQIFVPEAELQTPLMRDREGVVLKTPEYARLVKAAQQQLDAQASTHGQVIVQQTHYKASVDADRLVAELTVDLDNATQTWGQASIQVGAWQIERARLVSGEEEPSTPLLSRAEGTVQVFLSQPGRHQLILDLSLPLQAVGGDKLAEVDLTGAASGEFALVVPAGRNLLLDGSELPRPAPLAEAATYALPTGGRAKLSLLLTDRKQTTRSDVLTFASTAYGVNVAPGEVTWQARTSLQVFGRPIDQLVCTVPASLEITDVESEGLESWKLEDAAGDRTAITLQYRQPFEGTRRIQFRGLVSSQPDAPWTVPDLIFSGVTSHVGTLVVSHPSGVRLQAIEARGVRAVTQLPLEEGLVAVGKHLMFQVWDEQFTLSFATSAKQQQVRAAMTNVLDIHRGWVDLFTTVNLESRFAPMFEARVQLPDGWMIVTVDEEEAAANWTLVPGDDGTREVRIPLTRPLNPGESREIALTSMFQPDDWPVGTTPQTIALPEVRLPQAGMVEALYGIVADSAFDVVPQSIVGLDPARQDDLDSLNQRLAGIGKQVRLGYAYQDTVFSGALEVLRKPASIAANTMTFVRLDRDALFASVEARLSVSGGGTRELQFGVAEAAGSDLRFEVISLPNLAPNSAGLVRIVEQDVSEPVGGMRTWTLKLDRYLVGEAMFRAVIQVPRDPAVAETPVPGWSVVGAEQQSGYLAVEAADDQRVRVDANGGDGAGLRSVDPIDFPRSVYQPQERVVAAYQYLRPGWQVTIAAERFDRSPVPTAVAQHLQLNSIVSRTGEVQQSAELQFTAVGVQSLLVRLPEDASLWSILLDGQPVEVRRTESGYQVPLTAGDARSQRQLMLVYSTTGVALSGGGEFRSQPPTFAVVAGTGEEQSLEVLDQEWNLSTPRSTLLFDSKGLFEPIERLHRGVISGMLQNLVRLPDWSRLSVATIAIAIAIVLLVGLRMFLIRISPRWRWGVLVGLCLLVVPAALLMLTVPSGIDRMAGSAVRYGNEFSAMEMPRAEELGEKEHWHLNESGAIESKPMISNSVGAATTQPVPSAPQSPADPFAAGGQMQNGLSASQFNLQMPSEGLVPSAPGLADRQLGESERQRLAGQSNANQMLGALPSAPQAKPQEADESHALQVEQSQQVDSLQAAPVLTDREGRAPSSGRRLARWDAGGGLLSMTVQLQRPDEMRTHRFVYRGNGTGGEIRVKYADQRACQMLLLSIAAGMVLFGWWWLRKASWMTRSLWVLLTIAIPWAVAPLVPATGQLILEAILCGGLGTVLLWFFYVCVQQCVQCCSAGRCCLIRLWPICRRTAGLWLVCGVLTGVIRAEDSKPMGPAPVEPEPYVIIPYSPGQNPLDADRIFVPHELHQKLWQAAHPEDRPTGPDVQASVVEALYSASLVQEGDVSRIEVQGRFTIVKSRPDREAVTLPFQQGIVRAVQLNGEPAALDAHEKLRVAVATPGLHTVDVTFEVPVRFNGPAGEFRLTLDKTPAASLVFQVPEQMKVGGSGTYRRLPSDDGPARVLIPVDQGGVIHVSWQPESQQSSLTGTISVETTTAVAVEDAGLSVNHRFHITPRQEAIQQLSFSMSSGAAVRKISGQDVGGWEMNEEGTSLKVFLRRPVDEPTDLSIDVFQTLQLDEETKTIAVPQVAPLDVTTETGLIGVYAGEQFVLRSAPSTGVSQLDNSAFALRAATKEREGQPALTYRYVMRPFELKLLVGRRPPEARAVAEHGVSIQRHKLTIASRILFELTGAPRPSVSVELSDGYLPIDVAAPQLSDWYITRQDDGIRILTIELEEPRVGSLPVVLEGRLTRDLEEPDIYVELPIPVDVTRLESTLGLWLNEGDTGIIRSDEDWRSIDPSQLPATLRQLDSAAPQFAFRSTELLPYDVKLRVQSSSPELQADVVTLLAATDATVDYGFTFRWKISRAAADVFQFTGPDWLAGRLEVNAPGLREVVESEAPGGRRLWTVSLVEPVRDQYLMTAVATLPSPENQQLPTPLIQFQQQTAEESALLEFQRQYAILVNLSTAQLVPVDPAQIESVTRDQLPLVVSEQLVQQAMEIARVRPQRVPTWQLQRMDTQQDAAATVTGADLLTVIQADGSWRTRAAYQLRNRGRQFLAVRLPEGARLLSVIVANQPARAVTTTISNGDVQLVALPQTSEADLSFEIKLILAGELPSALPGGMGLRSQLVVVPVPQVISPKESAEFGLTVAQTSWNVHFPDDFLVAPVNDVRQTNLTWNRGQQVWLASELNRLSSLKADAMEMIRIAKDRSASYSRRQQAANNLKQIGLALHNYSDLPESEQLQKSNRELYEEVQGNLDFDVNGTQTFNDQQLDGAAYRGRHFILDNNDSLFSSNTAGKALSTESESRSNFNYRDQGLAEFESGAGKKAPAKGEISRAKLKSQLQEQRAIGGNTLNNDFGAVGGGGGGLGGGFGGGGLAGEMSGRRQVPRYSIQQSQQGGYIANEPALSFSREAMPTNGMSNDLDLLAQRERPAAWSAVGGLSLDLELPVNGQSFSFSKVGGDPHLTFVARPRQFTTLLTGGLWGLVWLVLGLWACHWLSRLSGLRSVVRILATVGCVAGLLGFLLLDNDFAWLCFFMFGFSGFVLVVTDPLLTTSSRTS